MVSVGVSWLDVVWLEVVCSEDGVEEIEIALVTIKEVCVSPEVSLDTTDGSLLS